MGSKFPVPVPKCKKCDGRGWVRVQGPTTIYTDMVACGDCFGRGIQPKPKAPPAPPKMKTCPHCGKEI